MTSRYKEFLNAMQTIGGKYTLDEETGALEVRFNRKPKGFTDAEIKSYVELMIMKAMGEVH